MERFWNTRKLTNKTPHHAVYIKMIYAEHDAVVHVHPRLREIFQISPIR